ncbi:MAG TPA: protein translocase subunit SecF [Terriglobales bacterium]|nr:protein translocase subunit SecF [Terriglobales bacterium]
MFEIIPPNTKFDFIGWQKPALGVSLVLVALSLALLLGVGPKLGIDFAGGSVIHPRFANAKQTDEVRAAVRDAGFSDPDIQEFGKEGKEFLIRVPLSAQGVENVSERISGALRDKFGADQVEILRVESVGPRVGETLRERAILAILFATLMMGIYIWVRFEWRYGVGTGAAILHDVIIVAGCLVAFGYEFDLNIVAALLTVVGFSVNDKVVVSDRIREARQKDRRSPLATIINRSVNETLSRTILTNGTAFLAVLSLYLLGGSVLHGFAFSLVIGSIIGTYSSIYVASTIVLFFDRPATAPRAAVPAARRS